MKIHKREQIENHIYKLQSRISGHYIDTQISQSLMYSLRYELINHSCLHIAVKYIRASQKGML